VRTLTPTTTLSGQATTQSVTTQLLTTGPVTTQSVTTQQATTAQLVSTTTTQSATSQEITSVQSTSQATTYLQTTQTAGHSTQAITSAQLITGTKPSQNLLDNMQVRIGFIAGGVGVVVVGAIVIVAVFGIKRRRRKQRQSQNNSTEYLQIQFGERPQSTVTPDRLTYPLNGTMSFPSRGEGVHK
jgi:peptidoglycan hydrolase-like protein with peptidoglycan-binding domain